MSVFFPRPTAVLPPAHFYFSARTQNNFMSTGLLSAWRWLSTLRHTPHEPRRTLHCSYRVSSYNSPTTREGMRCKQYAYSSTERMDYPLVRHLLLCKLQAGSVYLSVCLSVCLSVKEKKKKKKKKTKLGNVSFGEG